MYTVGIDMVEIERIHHCMRHDGFCRRILGEEEYRQLEKRGMPAQSVAASFCAKEAFSKAMGTGIRGFSFSEVQLLRLPNGKPYLSFTGRAKAMVQPTGLEFAVSITHTKQYAAAVVVASREVEA